MTIERWDPFGEMLTLRDAMNRLFEESFVRPSLATTQAPGMIMNKSIMTLPPIVG